jgi:hypothetical protein
MVIHPSGPHVRAIAVTENVAQHGPSVGTCSDNSYHHHRHHDYYYYSDCGRVHSGASKVRSSTFVSTITPVAVAVVNTTPSSSSSSSFVISNIFCICLLRIICKSSTKFRSVGWSFLATISTKNKQQSHRYEQLPKKQPLLVLNVAKSCHTIYTTTAVLHYNYSHQGSIHLWSVGHRRETIHSATNQPNRRGRLRCMRAPGCFQI